MFEYLDDTINQMKSILGKLNKAKQDVINYNLHCGYEDDARLNCLRILPPLLVNGILGLQFIRFHLVEEENWQKYLDSSWSEDDRYKQSIRFDSFVRLGLFIGYQTVSEYYLRVFLRELSDDLATDEIKRIINRLFGEIKLQTSKEVHYRELLNIMNTIRNTLHNNGVYYHARKTKKKLSYRKQEYELSNGKAIDFFTWPLLLNMIDDTSDLMIDIINSEAIINRRHKIYDPKTWIVKRKKSD